MPSRLTVEEAADYVRLAKGTLDNLRTAGNGPRFIKLGREILYDTKDLDRWLSSFKAELITYRYSMKPPATPGGLGNRNSADLQLIGRWLERRDAENLWKNISDAAPDLQAAEFVKEVLRARRKAQSHINRIYGAANIKGGYPARFAGFQDEWNALRKKELSAGVLAAANALYIRAYDLLTDEYQPSRQDIRGSRVLLLFSEIIGEYLQAKCGRWLDVQIAQLAEIALNLEPGEVSPKTISDARTRRSKKAH